MSTNAKRWGVFLTVQAVEAFKGTYIADYFLQDTGWLDCTSLDHTPHYLFVRAHVRNRLDEEIAHEFLIPHHFVLYVVTNPDRKILGFSSTREARGSS